MMRSANPTLTAETFRNVGHAASNEQAMTVEGTASKSLILLFCVFLTAGWTWTQFTATGSPEAITGWMWGGIIGGLVFAMATIFKKEWAPITSPCYALCQGLFLGGISATLEAAYPGIVIQAIGLTFGTAAALFFLYRARIIQATEKFKMGIFAATGGIAIVYVASLLLGFFGIQIPFIFGNGLFGIGFSVFVVTIAALNLIIDFDFIEKGAQAQVPKYMEWYGAFALMVTLVWLYIEILRLLAKLRSRN